MVWAGLSDATDARNRSTSARLVRRTHRESACSRYRSRIWACRVQDHMITERSGSSDRTSRRDSRLPFHSVSLDRARRAVRAISETLRYHLLLRQ